MTKSFSHIGLIGLGLIGSSIARATKFYSPEIKITGFDLDQQTRTEARALNLCDHIYDDAADAVKNAQCVIFSIPISNYQQAATSIKEGLSPEAILTDTGSTKRGIYSILQSILPKNTEIIPAHPVAGTENSGPRAGLKDLFLKRYCIFTPPSGSTPETIEKLKLFWERIGSSVRIMTPEDHDYMLGAISHLPHLVAWGLVGTVLDMQQDEDPKTHSSIKNDMVRYAAGGFRDFTRIAASNPIMWRDIFLNNQDNMVTMLDKFIEKMISLKSKIINKEGQALEDYFIAANHVRLDIVDQEQAGKFIATETSSSKNGLSPKGKS